MPVYMIRCGENGPVKIGHSADPQHRLAQLQTSHHERLSIIRTFEGGTSVEIWLHRKFSRLRINGEWFSFTPLMLDVEPTENDTAPKRSEKPNQHIRAIISHFGGQWGLARAIGTVQGTVSEWVATGFIPSQRIPAIIEAAKALNPPVHLQANDFFGLQHSEEAA
jgi:hypothetical protein